MESKTCKVPLVEGQAEYNFAADSENFPEDLDTVLEAYYETIEQQHKILR